VNCLPPYHVATCRKSVLLHPTQEQALYHQHLFFESENANLVQYNSSVYLWFVVVLCHWKSDKNFDDFVGSVLLFTGICLAMAGHFQSVLAASDLSAYDLPFVSVAVLKSDCSSFRSLCDLRMFSQLIYIYCSVSIR
jgi:hypothetical protein